MRKSTLLFVFVHGFKGDNDTFGEFPEHLQAVLQTARPHLHIRTAIYPQFETRGDLKACVSRFHSWLQNTVIDMEVESHTPSPTVDPSVHTILVGHSMGGIVAADALLSILDDEPIGDQHVMFPHVAGVMAFDTPYLGLAPSMFAHGVGEKWKGATAAYSTLTGITSGLFATETAKQAAVVKATNDEDARQQRNQRESKGSSTSTSTSTSTSGWGWGTMAALAGGAVALGGGAAAAYWRKDDIGAGFNWVSSHLEFVGALMKGEELKNRVERVSTASDVGFANLFTSLGGEKVGTMSVFDGRERTFCSIPDKYSAVRKKFYRCVNPKVDDEVGAHVSMFKPSTNPNYYELADRAKNLVMVWVPEDAWMPVEDDYDAYHPKSSSKSSSSRRGSKYDFYEKPPKPERRDSARSEKMSRSGSGSGTSSTSRRGSKYESYDFAPKPERRGSSSARSEKYDVYEKPPKPERRSTFNDAIEKPRSEKSSSSRRSSTYDVYEKPPKPERRSTFDVSSDKPPKSERRSSRTVELERRPESGANSRRSSTYGGDDRSRTHSIHESSSGRGEERRGSKHSSRQNTPDVERVKMERKSSSRSSKDGRDKGKAEYVDLEHNPWK